MEEENRIDLNALNDDVQIIDIATKLQDYDESEIIRLCSALSDEKMAMVLEQTDEDTQVQIIDSLTNQRTLSIFDYMQKDDNTGYYGGLFGALDTNFDVSITSGTIAYFVSYQL